MGRLRENRRGLLTSQADRTKLTNLSGNSNGCSNLVPPMAVFNTARVRLFVTQSHNPLFVYKAFQFAIILTKILFLFLPRTLGYDCNDFGVVSLQLTHCACRCMRSCTRLRSCTHGPVHHRNCIFSHTQVHSTLAHTRWLYMYMYCTWHSINLSDNDGAQTHNIVTCTCIIFHVCTGH